MRRYENIPTIKDDSGRRHSKTVVMSNVPYSPKDIYVQTAVGDRLDTLAFDFYGEVKYWWVIASANALPGDSLYPPIGVQLRIPTNIQTVLSTYNLVNNVR